MLGWVLLLASWAARDSRARRTRVLGLWVGLLASACGGGGPSQDLLPASSIALTPASLDFGDLGFGEEVRRQITMKNLGDEPLSICLPLLASDTCPAPSTIGPSELGLAWPTSDMTWTLGGGETSTFTIGFTPSVAGAVTGKLVLRHHPSVGNRAMTSLGGQVSLPVSASVSRPKLTLSESETSAIDFGLAAVGFEKTKTLVLTNATTPSAKLAIRFVADPAAIFGVRTADGTNLDSTSSVELAAGEQTSVTLWFRPQAVGKGEENEGRLQVLACSSDACTTTLELKGEGILPEGSIDGNGTADFGDHDVGVAKEIDLTVRSTGAAPLTVTGVVFDAAGQGLFAAEGNTFPKEIAAGTSATIRVQHLGRTPGEDQAQLTLDSNAANQLKVTLVAHSHGPNIETSPAALDFEAVNPNLGIPKKLMVTIRNQGDRQLQLSAIDVSGAGYSLSPAPSLGPLEPGQTRAVTVAFLPSSPDVQGPQLGALTIRSNDFDAPTLEVPLLGFSGTPTGCSMVATPVDLDFGAVAPGTTSYLVVEARNLGAQACDVGRVALDGSGSEFSLTENYGGFSLMPGARAHFVAAYTPSNSGADSATLRFLVTSGGAELAAVNIVGTGFDPGLRALPTILDAGIANVGCFAPTATLRLFNGSTGWMRVASVYLDAYASDAFEPSFGPSRSVEIDGGQFADFNFRYAPKGEGDDTSVIYADIEGCPGCGAGGKTRLAIPIFGSGIAAGETVAESFTVSKAERIDILFVIEFTNRMYSERLLLTEAFPAFLAQLRSLGVDFRIAVASTYPNAAQNPVGGSVTITPSTPDADAHALFREWLAVESSDASTFGTSGSGLRRALDTARSVGRSAIVRPDARLAIVFMSEGEGGGDTYADPKIDELRKLKDTRGRNTTISAIVATDAATGECDESEASTNRTLYGKYAPTFIQMAEKSGGVAISICGESSTQFGYAPSMPLLAKFAAGLTLRFPLRGQTSAGARPTVRVTEPSNSTSTPSFTHDAADGSILVSKNTYPSFGSRIDVEYEAACISNAH
ncbi:MAG: choice-of-anchor D domain-containing protein [Deltaproteobacteria bacterium]|nr:choice-of-anchor D domain-containing protein [Deltaproteobacteria bacterium]